jgi:hypothetical protein
LIALEKLWIIRALLVLVVLALASCVPSNAIVITFTPEPTPDLFATEMGITSEEMLELIVATAVEPSNNEKERILLEFLKQKIQDPGYDKSSSQLHNYLDSVEVQVEDGNIIFYIYRELTNDQHFYSLFEELFFAGLVHATNASGNFVWDVDSIDVVFVKDDGSWVDIYMDRQAISAFIKSPDSLYDLVQVETSED